MDILNYFRVVAKGHIIHCSPLHGAATSNFPLFTESMYQFKALTVLLIIMPISPYNFKSQFRSIHVYHQVMFYNSAVLAIA
jgi:hypothetical protein